MWSSHDAAEASNLRERITQDFTNSAHSRLQQLLLIVKLFPRHTNSHTISNLALRVGRDNILVYFLPRSGLISGG